MEIAELIYGIEHGNRRALGKAITLIENRRYDKRQQAYQLMAQLQTKTESIRLAFSGPPGVGKSTFIESFGKLLLEQGHKLAILAIDPSSTVSNGSILGDKTRMVELSSHPNCFIRPSPTAGSLGGVTRRTHEVIGLCEAAGYDRIIVETVGVGQSETLASTLSDIFIVLQLPNSGDDLQGMKKGILELADLILINKADGDLKLAAIRAKSEIQAALDLLIKRHEAPAVMSCSALEKLGLEDILKYLEANVNARIESGEFAKKRKLQALQAFNQSVKEELLAQLEANPSIHFLLENLRKQVFSLSLNPSLAIEKLWQSFNININTQESYEK